MRPIRRPLGAWLRNRLRRRTDLVLHRAGCDPAFHYRTHADRVETNRGDIAIRIASRALLAGAFAEAGVPGAEIVDIGWSGFDAAAVARIAPDLMVIGGGGYYYLDAEGRLADRVARDLDVLSGLQCPIVSLCPGVNRLLRADGSGDDGVDAATRETLARLLDRLALSSARDETSTALLERALPGRTVTLADPALFLTPSGSPPPSRHDGLLRIGLNLAFHGPNSSRTLLARLAVVATAMRMLARQEACRFTYFVHSDPERLIPYLLRQAGVPVAEVVDCDEPAEMVTRYAGIDMHVCQMLHSSILAMNAGVPTLNLGYDTKNAAFLRLMGVERYCLPAAATDATAFGTALAALVAERARLAPALRARKVVLRAEMDAYLARLAALVRGPGPEGRVKIGNAYLIVP